MGRLSQREASRLAERTIRYLVFKIVFSGAVVPDLEDPREVVLWFLWFAALGYCRVFVGLVKDRLEALAALPRAPSLLAHLRPVALGARVMAQASAAMWGVWGLLGRGAFGGGGGMPSVKLLLCAFDVAVIFVEEIRAFRRYGERIGGGDKTIDHLLGGSQTLCLSTSWFAYQN